MPPLVFLHLPKTAGTTLHKVLTHQYRPSEIVIHHDTDGPPPPPLLERLGKNSEQARLVIGHVSARFHESCPDVRYITCLRNPVARVRSLYEHARADPQHYLHDAATSMSLVECAGSGLSGEFSNGMVRMLAGVENFHSAELGQESLDKAIDVLKHHTSAFCLTERFDESLWLMAKKLNWKAPWYMRRKIGSYTRAPLTSAERKNIEALNGPDCELYANAAEILEGQLSSSPVAFGKEVENFKCRNSREGSLIFLGREAFRRLGQLAPF